MSRWELPPFTLDLLLANTRAQGACRIWKGSTRGRGYAQIYDRRVGKQRAAHVVVWELLTGRSVRPGQQVAHRCDKPRCIAPACLFLTNQSGNERDKWNKGRGRAPRSPRDPVTGRWCKP